MLIVFNEDKFLMHTKTCLSDARTSEEGTKITRLVVNEDDALERAQASREGSPPDVQREPGRAADRPDACLRG